MMMRFVIDRTARVGEGPFLFLPVLGPSNPRDATGFGGQFVLDPLTYASFGGSSTLGFSRAGPSAVDTRAGLLDQIDDIKRGALATFRSLDKQHRVDEVANAKANSAPTPPAWFSR